MIEKHIKSEDDEIIELYFARDELAIDKTDKKYGGFLYSIAYNILADREDCLECQNDTYLGLWNSIPPNRPRVFLSYISQIMRRIAINRYKEKHAKKRVPSELTVALDELEYAICEGSDLNAEELATLINSFLRSLTVRERYIFIERYYMSTPVKDIARELGVSSATLYRELLHQRMALAEHLKENGVNDI